MNIELAQVLIDNRIISDESRTKACIITDIVKLGKLMGVTPPDWEEFCELYSMSIPELELMQTVVEHNYRCGRRSIEVDWLNITKE